MSDDVSPETSTAEDRRQTWLEREMSGFGDENDWDYSGELHDILETRLRAIELILGKTRTAPHLLAMLPCHNISSDDWCEILDEYWPASWLETAGGALIDRAGLYGLYGVTPADVPQSEREGWLGSLSKDLSAFVATVQPTSNGVITRIINLALSRHAIDTGKGEVDPRSLAILGGVTEGRIRNILSSSDSGLERVGPNVTGASAAAWLRGRKEFFASIWDQPDEAAPEPVSPDFSDEVVFVPVAGDGSLFHPGLARGGRFTIGAKGAESQHSSFDAALAALHKMATPKWRRPNEAGNWGIVSGRDWKRIERGQLLSM